MALLQVNFTSQSLMRTVPINVILPVDKITLDPERNSYPTLYLLHGVLGNYTDWIIQTSIKRWAEEKNLAVVMPSGDNMFYVDQKEGNNFYGEFIGKELVEITRRMFPLSRRREDTFIAGLSMGGFGALRNGLKYHETFGYIAGLSNAMFLEGVEERKNDSTFFLDRRDYMESVFGDLSRVGDSDKNPRWLAKRIADRGESFPEIYIACGTEDSLLEKNRALRDYLRKLGAPVTYEEGPGSHEWDFWNCYIKKVIDWLPLGEKCPGISSGNVPVKD